MPSFDVIVCGGGTSGICAAIASGRRKLKTCLVEENTSLGGTITQCLVNPLFTFHSAAGTQIVKGIAQEIIERLTAVGGCPGHLPDPIGTASSMTIIETQLYLQIVTKMLEEAGVTVLTETQVVGVLREESSTPRVFGVEIQPASLSRCPLTANLIIDATGDADVAILAGAEVTSGRASDGKTQPMTLLFTMENVEIAKIRRYIQQNPRDFVLSAAALDNLDAFPKLAVSGFFSQVLQTQSRGHLNFRDRVLAFELNQLDTMLINMTRILGFDGSKGEDRAAAYFIGLQQVEEVADFLISDIPGFEKAKIQTIAKEIGVRESKHLVGRYVLTANDILSGRKFKDGIAHGAFPIDIHSPDHNGLNLTKLAGTQGYTIPSRCLLPRAIEGLIVTGRCISASHEASASARVTATCMALGEAAGNMA